MINAKVPCSYEALQMRDVEFRREYDLFYIKKSRGIYDVLQGIELKLVGRLTHSYGQWCFVADSGDDRFHYGNTRSEAVWDWLKWLVSGG